MSSTLQNLLIVLGVLLIGGLGYYLYSQNNAIDLNNSAVNSQASIDSAQFLGKLQQLQTIQINGQIFTDPRFHVLTNLSVPVTPSYVGKTDPFQIGG